MKISSLNVAQTINLFIEYCSFDKGLSPETTRAYRSDLYQASIFFECHLIKNFAQCNFDSYTRYLSQIYSPRTARRKVSSLRSFFSFCSRAGWIHSTPASVYNFDYKCPSTLPRTIPISDIKKILSYSYKLISTSTTAIQKILAYRNTAIIELLYATGMRISEICSLSIQCIDLHTGQLLIHGKGRKERISYIADSRILALLRDYRDLVSSKGTFDDISALFISRTGACLTPQSIRKMLNQYALNAGVSTHITPHMFRHTFATAMIDADVNLRYVQEMLGHSSVRVTEIYTHCSTSKVKEIMETKHPRKELDIYAPNLH